MKKLKIAYLTKDMPINGISTVLMNYCGNLDKEKVEITVFSGPPIAHLYKKQCAELGIELVETPPKRQNSLAYYFTLLKKLSRKYDIVHMHGNSATITIELMIALIKGIKVRIAHCHNSTCESQKAHKLLQPLFKKIYTYGFACSNLAGKWLFDDCRFDVLPNGFHTKRFLFDQEKRNEIRKELRLEDKYVIGHVGMFNKQKNHPFLLKVFEQVAKERNDAYLLLVGQGPDFDKISRLIEQHPFKQQIICYGTTDHVEYLYDAMDTFVFPSIHEGLGIVLLEAQINGLPCIASDVVPKEAMLGNRVSFLPLDADLDIWEKVILQDKSIDRTAFYEEHKKEIEHYDITHNSKELLSLYMNLTAGNQK